jgi:hypothetical protein
MQNPSDRSSDGFNPNQQKRTIEPPLTVDEAGGGFDTGGNKGSGRKAGGNMLYLLMVGVLVVSMLGAYYFSSSKVSIVDETKNFAGVTQSITNIQNDLKATQANLTTVLNKNADIQAQLSALTSSVSSAANSASSANTIASNALTKANEVASQIKSLQDANTKAQSDLVALKDSVAALNTRLTTAESTIVTQGNAIKVLQTPTVIPTTTPTTTPSSHGVSVAITGNPYFQNKPILSFAALPVSVAATSTTPAVTNAMAQPVTFQITNVGSVAISNEQLAISLSLYSSDGMTAFTLPNDAKITLGSPLGVGIIWTSVVTGQSNVLGFQTAVSSGIFSNVISLAVGESKTFTVNVTLTAGTTNAVNGFLIAVQVIPLPST